LAREKLIGIMGAGKPVLNITFEGKPEKAEKLVDDIITIEDEDDIL